MVGCLHIFYCSLTILCIGKEKIVQELLNKDANRDAVNNEGLSALMLAARKGKKNLIQFNLIRRRNITSRTVILYLLSSSLIFTFT